jgi:hypothetical protein
LLTNHLLDVHKVHLVLGRIGGAAVLAWLRSHAPEVLANGESANDLTSHYATQNSDAATKFVKGLFNWRLMAEEREPVLAALLDYAFAGAPPAWNDVYLDASGFRALTDAKMGVGPHSHKHELSSRLTAEQEAEEVELSCAFIERVGGSRMWGYCYPYGSLGAFTTRTQQAVAKAGCPFAFAVYARDIEEPFATSARYALPRHNCNAFPHGAASFGEVAPSDPIATDHPHGTNVQLQASFQDQDRV